MLIGYVRQENVVQRPDVFQMGDTDTLSHLPEEHRRLKYRDTFYGEDGSFPTSQESLISTHFA